MANVFPLSFPPRPSNPSPFGFGFGGGIGSTSTPSSPLHSPSSFGSPLRRPQPTTPSSLFGRPYQPPSPSVFGAPSSSSYGHSHGASAPSPSKRKSASTSTSTNPSKRRGREDDDDEEDEDSDMGAHGDPSGGGGGERQIAGRVIRRGGKKSRVDQTDSTKLDPAPSSPTKQPSQQEDGVDVGVLLGQSDISSLFCRNKFASKACENEADLPLPSPFTFNLLALLPSTSLLPILTSLVTLHPELKSTLLSLIPTPSLSSALEALRLADEKIRIAVPFGWSPVNHSSSSSSRGSIFGGGGGGVSESYVLGRIQGPVGELACLVSTFSLYFLLRSNQTLQPNRAHLLLPSLSLPSLRSNPTSPTSPQPPPLTTQPQPSPTSKPSPLSSFVSPQPSLLLSLPSTSSGLESQRSGFDGSLP